MDLLRECCVENFERVPAAIAAGAARIELCDNLAVGGTTPSAGVIEKATSYARDHGAGVMVMIRPRGGSFIFDADERDIMLRDVRAAREAGATGIVIGCLRDGDVDRDLAGALLAERGDLDATFHMAFDALAPDRQLDAIDWLAGQGVSRILSHGGPLDRPIDDTLAHLKELRAYAGDRIAVMPGGGVSYRNAGRIAAELGVREVHGSAIVRMGA